MTPEQLLLYDYEKNNVSAEICIDALLTSISVSHQTLYTLLTNECVTKYVEDEVIIDAIAEVLHYQEPLSLNTCPECMTDAYGYKADNTNLAECNKCGTFFKLRKH